MKLEIEAAKNLVKSGNWDREAFLAMFNPEFRAILVPRLPKASDIKFISEKGTKAKCVNCKKSYVSYNVKEELGKCSFCNAKESQECLSLDAFNFSETSKIVSKKDTSAKKIFPHFIEREKRVEIMKYFVENYYELKLFKKKIHALGVINEKFNVDISEQEFYSLMSPNAFNSHGVKWR